MNKFKPLLNEESNNGFYTSSHLNTLTHKESECMEGVPTYDYYYKLVAKLHGKYLSIFDPSVEYKINTELVEKALPDHKGGYYVYATPKEAVFADVPCKPGGLFMAPRTVLKVQAWGDFVVYDNGKLSFSHIVPIADLGLPRGYKISKAAWKESIKSENTRNLKNREKK